MGALRYFHFQADQINDVKAVLTPDGDTLPLGEFRNIHVLHTFDDGSKLVQIWIENNVIADIMTGMDSAVPLSLESVAEMDIAGSYVGMGRDEIEARFPELAGQVEITDEDDTTRMVDKLVLPVMFGESL